VSAAFPGEGRLGDKPVGPRSFVILDPRQPGTFGRNGKKEKLMIVQGGKWLQEKSAG